jgi:hypothetical protein
MVSQVAVCTCSNSENVHIRTILVTLLRFSLGVPSGCSFQNKYSAGPKKSKERSHFKNQGWTVTKYLIEILAW